MGQLLRQLGCTVEIDYPGRRRPDHGADVGQGDHRRARGARPRGALRAGTPPAGLDRRAGAAGRPLPPGERRAARRRRDRLPRPGHAHPRAARARGRVRIEHGQVVAEVPERLRGANLWLDFPSVGATENLLMAAVLAEGTTVIDNVAREPEIVDLCQMLVAMGARIEGISTSTLVDRGRRPAEPGRAPHRDRPDRRRDLGLRQPRSPGATCTSSGGVRPPPRHRAGQAGLRRRRGRARRRPASRCAPTGG